MSGTNTIIPQPLQNVRTENIKYILSTIILTISVSSILGFIKIQEIIKKDVGDIALYTSISSVYLDTAVELIENKTSWNNLCFSGTSDGKPAIIYIFKGMYIDGNFSDGSRQQSILRQGDVEEYLLCGAALVLRAVNDLPKELNEAVQNRTIFQKFAFIFLNDPLIYYIDILYDLREETFRYTKESLILYINIYRKVLNMYV